MRKLGIVSFILIAAVVCSAQSLKPRNPYPLRSGINQATSDSLVGTHYWYFYAEPGTNVLRVRLKSPTTLYGARMNTVVSVTLSDAKNTWRITKTVTDKPNSSSATFNAPKISKRIKIIVAVAPPNQNLIRMGGDYEIDVSGDVSFGESASSADPIIRTYDSKVNSYGATRFLADGTVITSDGYTGTWKAFDADNRIYTVVIDRQRFSVQYLPGYGLVKPSDPSLIVFQELRR